ncbi:hypothetical protein V6N13_091874 [Hibiscus sabdariffa]
MTTEGRRREVKRKEQMMNGAPGSDRRGRWRFATVAPIAVADCYENDFPCVFDNECCSGYYSYANGFGGAFGTCWPLPN